MPVSPRWYVVHRAALIALLFAAARSDAPAQADPGDIGPRDLVPPAREPANTRRDRRPPSELDGDDAGRESRRPLIFYPPTPPPLDRPVARLASPAGRFAAPAELAPFVNEVFYPVLGTRLYTQTLFAELNGKVAGYRTAKELLQDEIRATVDKNREAGPAVRRQAIENLARVQTPRIASLEATAETLRRKMITANIHWSTQRQWHLNDREARAFSPGEIAEVMRGYAYYHDGLSAPQRRLLREITLELMYATDRSSDAPTVRPEIFFSPEPARVLLPDSLPPDLVQKVATYQATRSQLKKELYDSVYAYDGAVFGFFRHSFKALAEKQAPGFAMLETLAEEIRVGLAQMTEPARPPESSPLPPTLALRVTQVVRAASVARRDATNQADAIMARVDRAGIRNRIVYRFGEEGMVVTRIPARGPPRPGSEFESEILDDVQARLAVVAADYGRKLAELLNEQEAIRAAATEALGETRRDRVEAALIAANRIAVLRENEDAYRDYRIAVFEPGLSPGQRRLLFDRAVVKLELPLPRGEPQPLVRPSRW